MASLGMPPSRAAARLIVSIRGVYQFLFERSNKN